MGSSAFCRHLSLALVREQPTHLSKSGYLGLLTEPDQALGRPTCLSACLPAGSPQHGSLTQVPDDHASRAELTAPADFVTLRNRCLAGPG